MKKLIHFRMNLFLFFLLSTLAASANVIPGAIRGNWQNPMAQSTTEDLVGGSTYIFLNNQEELYVNLVVTTTDYQPAEYAPLYLSYAFGDGPNVGTIGPITSTDLVQTELGIFEATFPLVLNFVSECEIDPDGLFNLPIRLELETMKESVLVPYPLEENTGLFLPELYDVLSPMISITDKIMTCWRTDPSILSTTNGSDLNTIASTTDKGEQSLTSSLSPKVSPIDELELLTAQPNPFTEDLQIKYKLETPSDIQISILNMQGQVITEQRQKTQPAGLHTQSFNFEQDIPAGIYIVQFSYASKSKAIKLIKLKEN